MNSRSFIIILLLTVTFLIIGCDDNPYTHGDRWPDRVIGLIDGVVQDGNTNESLGGIYIVYWIGDDEPDIVITLEDGSFSIPEELQSGEYFLHVMDPVGEYSMDSVTVIIPTLNMLKGDFEVSPTREEVYYRISFLDECETDTCLGAILLSK